jgi:uncharacterized protein (UPF0264 family)
MAKPNLLVSVFNPEEVRAAVAGGADVIDCEDPRADVGMFEPRVVTDVAFAVRQCETTRVIPTSANIGFSLQTFHRSDLGGAYPRTNQEVMAKAAQEALGIAASMDVGDSRSNIIKFGLDGLKKNVAGPLVSMIKTALRNSQRYQNHLTIGSYLEIDHDEWERRRTDQRVIRSLLDVGQFYFTKSGPIDLLEYYPQEKVTKLQESAAYFTRKFTKGKLEIDPEWREEKISYTTVELVEPIDPSVLGFSEVREERMRAYIDLIADAGADGVMIDTPIQAKSARICLVKHEKNETDDGGGTKLPRSGIFDVDILKKFADYCAFRGVQSWLAGSIQPYHAEALGKIDSLDMVLCRDSASDVVKSPYPDSGAQSDDRNARRITRDKVALMIKSLKE